MNIDELNLTEKCSEFLQLTKRPLYHGNKNSQPFFKTDVFSTRNPNDTKLSNICSEIMKYNGLTANKFNSVFCTGDAVQAKGFGNLYRAYPANGFTYSWNPNIKDVNLFFDRYMFKYGSNTFINMTGHRVPKEVNEKQFVNDMEVKYLKLFNEYYGGDDKSLDRAISSGNEILIHGTVYFVKEGNVE